MTAQNEDWASTQRIAIGNGSTSTQATQNTAVTEHETDLTSNLLTSSAFQAQHTPTRRVLNKYNVGTEITVYRFLSPLDTGVGIQIHTEEKFF